MSTLNERVIEYLENGGSVTISGFQRSLRLSYNNAAQLMDSLINDGIVIVRSDNRKEYAAKNKPTKRDELNRIIAYVGNISEADAELLKEIRCHLHDAAIITRVLCKKERGMRYEGTTTTTVGNLAAELGPFINDK